MNTVKAIKEVLARKELLEHNIYQLERSISQPKMSDLVTTWSENNDRIDVRIDRDLMVPLLEKQLELYRAELAEIDKRVDAIGSLMSCGGK